MKQNWIKFVILVLVLTVCAPAYGRIHFTRLTSSEVYKALREAGRMDAVPEGRVVTQGIAAATGFLAGVAKGVGIPMLVGLFGGIGSTNSSSGETVTQEICFSSRSAFDVNENGVEPENEGEVKQVDNVEGEADNEEEVAYDGDDGRENPIQGRQTAPTTQTTNATPTTAVGTSSPTTTTGSSPTQTSTGTGTTDTDNNGSGTVTDSTTNTGTGGAVNCIVIQKPAIG